MDPLQVALVQMRCEKGAIDANLAAIEAALAAAARRGAEVACFPEMSITGYINPAERPGAVLSLHDPAVARFVGLTCGLELTALAGLVEANPAGKPFITQLVARGGELIGFYRKNTIIDEEAEWFAPGAGVPVFEHPRCRFSLAICADIESEPVFAAGARGGAQVVFEAAAPGLYGDQAGRNWQRGYEWWRGECRAKLGAYARAHRVPIAVATQAGRTVDEDFPGGGYLFGPNGACLAETPDWREQVLYAAVPLGTDLAAAA